MKKNILVSACLLGESCRYDGKSKPCERVMALKDTYNQHDIAFVTFDYLLEIGAC